MFQTFQKQSIKLVFCNLKKDFCQNFLWRQLSPLVLSVNIDFTFYIFISTKMKFGTIGCGWGFFGKENYVLEKFRRKFCKAFDNIRSYTYIFHNGGFFILGRRNSIL